MASKLLKPLMQTVFRFCEVHKRVTLHLITRRQNFKFTFCSLCFIKLVKESE